RARTHVHEKRPRYPLDDGTRQSVAENFLAACASGDIRHLLALLAPDVVMVADGGGVVSAARRPVVGADHVARFLLGIIRKYAALIERGADLAVEVVPGGVNGAPALVALLDRRVVYVYALELDEQGRITDVFGMANPAKLDAVQSLSGPVR